MSQSNATRFSGVSFSSQRRSAKTSTKTDVSYSSPEFERISSYPEPTFDLNYHPERYPSYVWLLGMGYNKFVCREVEDQVRKPQLLGELDGREYRVKRVLQPEEFYRRIPSELAIDTIAIFPTFPPDPPLMIRFDWTISGHTRHLEIWSPNASFGDVSEYYQPFDACPLYPGPAPQDIRSTKNALCSQWLFADGGLGPFDYTQFPQLFDSSRPWLGFIVKPYEAAYSPTGHVLAERVNVALVFVGMHKNIDSKVWPVFLQELRERNSNLDAEMERIKRYRPSDVEGYWEHRPEGPTAEVWEALTAATHFHDAVRWMGVVQRIMKEKDAFVQFFAVLPSEGLQGWSQSLVDKEEQGLLCSSVPLSDNMRVGVWLYNCQTDLAWVLMVQMRIPVYVLHEVTSHAAGELVRVEEEATPGRLARVNPYGHVNYRFVLPLHQAPLSVFPPPFSYDKLAPLPDDDDSEEWIGSVADHQAAASDNVAILLAKARNKRGKRERIKPVAADERYFIAEALPVEGEAKPWILPPAIRRAPNSGGWETWAEDDDLRDAIFLVSKTRYKRLVEEGGVKEVYDRLRKRRIVLQSVNWMKDLRGFFSDVDRFGVTMPIRYSFKQERAVGKNSTFSIACPSDWVYFSMEPKGGETQLPIPRNPDLRRWNSPVPLTVTTIALDSQDITSTGAASATATPTPIAIDEADALTSISVTTVPLMDSFEEEVDFELSEEEADSAPKVSEVLAGSSLQTSPPSVISEVLANSSPTMAVESLPSPVLPSSTILPEEDNDPNRMVIDLTPAPVRRQVSNRPRSNLERSESPANPPATWAEGLANVREYARQRGLLREEDRHWSEQDRDWDPFLRNRRERSSRRASSRSPSPPTSSAPSSSESSSDNVIRRFKTPPSAPRAFFRSGQPSQRVPIFPSHAPRQSQPSPERALIPLRTPSSTSMATTAQGISRSYAPASLNDSSLATSVFAYMWRDDPWGSELTIDEALCTLTYLAGPSTQGFSTLRLFIRQVGRAREIWLECPLPHDVTILTGLLNDHSDLHLTRVPFEEFQRHRNTSILQFNERVRHRVHDERSLVYMRDREPTVDISPLQASQASQPLVGWYPYRIRRVNCSRGFFLIHLEENQRLVHGKRGVRKRKIDSAADVDEEPPSQLANRISSQPTPSLQARLQDSARRSLEDRISSAGQDTRGVRGRPRGRDAARGRGRGFSNDDKSDSSSGPSLRDRLG